MWYFQSTTFIMKLILWLLISLFHLIYGNEEPPTTIIDTVELNEEHQKILKWINETKMRNIVKKSLWELKVKDEILKEKDEILKEKDAKLNNSVYTFVNCAMSQILSALEIGYQINATNSNVTPSNEDAYKICKRLLGYKDTDLHILIEREAHWTEKFDNRSYRKIPHEEVYVKEVLRYKDVWLKYLHSDEGRKLLVTLIGNESFDIKDQCPLLVRFSYNIARLYKIAYICCHKLLEELRKMILADPKKTFMNHLRDLVREWSCTAEQIYFYNKFVKFMFPENPESYYLTAYKFGKVKINQEREVTFVVPYTTENCGLQGSEETLTLLDTY